MFYLFLLSNLCLTRIVLLGHTTGFEIPRDEVEFLRRRLAEEQANTERATMARLEAETRCHLAEKERDVYRLLARRWKSRLSAASGDIGDIDAETIEEAAAAMLLGGRETLSVFGLGNLFRRHNARAAAHDTDDEEAEIGEDEEGSDEDASDRMEEEEDDDDDGGGDDTNEEMDAEEDDNHNEENDDGNGDDNSISMASDDRSSMSGIEATQAKSHRPQARTISIADDDF